MATKSRGGKLATRSNHLQLPSTLIFRKSFPLPIVLFPGKYVWPREETAVITSHSVLRKVFIAIFTVQQHL